ncbi:hypothetical protein F7R25_17170 [Burkholderia stagnalis]|uniref:Uncharacterized protein n=1 Tax=Burkholderia stagnalis TaxID=1503054 RepID=A0A6L3MW82_9BURK|nr:hypothetical protein F7R25_17170 [Burkholderia stagnalis]
MTLPFDGSIRCCAMFGGRESGSNENGVSTTGQLSVQTVVVGHDTAQPLVAVGYATQVIGGVVVLSCH